MALWPRIGRWTRVESALPPRVGQRSGGHTIARARSEWQSREGVATVSEVKLGKHIDGAQILLPHTPGDPTATSYAVASTVTGGQRYAGRGRDPVNVGAIVGTQARARGYYGRRRHG